MVGTGQIVVDGFWHTHEADVAADQVAVIRELLNGVHGIISADVKESFDLELLKEGEDLLVNFVIFLDFGEFVAAAPEEGRRGSLQKVDVQIRADVFREIYIFMFQKAVDAVAHSVYFPGAPVLCRLENAGKAGIDDGSGAAGLADDDISLHGKSSVWF